MPYMRIPWIFDDAPIGRIPVTDSDVGTEQMHEHLSSRARTGCLLGNILSGYLRPLSLYNPNISRRVREDALLID